MATHSSPLTRLWVDSQKGKSEKTCSLRYVQFNDDSDNNNTENWYWREKENPRRKAADESSCSAAAECSPGSPQAAVPSQAPQGQPGAADHEAAWSVVPWVSRASCPGCVPSQLTTQGWVGSRKRPWLCIHCSAVTKTSWSYQRCLQH